MQKVKIFNDYLPQILKKRLFLQNMSYLSEVHYLSLLLTQSIFHSLLLLFKCVFNNNSFLNTTALDHNTLIINAHTSNESMLIKMTQLNLNSVIEVSWRLILE